ncbi:MAG: methyltransferase [Candidatus Aegiribacteria sp.]
MEGGGDPGAPVTTDTLLLASLLSVPPGSTVVDLGCGSGGAMEAASEKNPGCRWIGIDIRPRPLAEMMRTFGSSSLNAVCCRVEDVPRALPGEAADAVICNPPFTSAGRGRVSPCPSRSVSRTGSELLVLNFIRAAAHLLVPGGCFLLVGRPSMLPVMMLGCSTWNLGPETLQPVGRKGGPAVHAVLRCGKGSSAELIILPQSSAEEIISGGGTEGGQSV